MKCQMSKCDSGELGTVEVSSFIKVGEVKTKIVTRVCRKCAARLFVQSAPISISSKVKGPAK